MRATTLTTAAVAAIVLGGSSESDPLNPQTSDWEQVAAFGGPALEFSAALTIGGMAYVGTGTGSARQSLRDFWRMGAVAAR